MSGMGKPEGSLICIIRFSIFESFSREKGKGKGKNEGAEKKKKKKRKKACMTKGRGNVINLTMFKCLGQLIMPKYAWGLFTPV